MKKILFLAVSIFAIAGILYLLQKHTIQSMTPQSATIHVVAAENFYGDIVQQLGGSHVSVTSILSDPNVDPHEYESSTQDAVALANADLVIKNGLDYDTWIDHLLSASPKTEQVVMTAGDIAPMKLSDNPHVWYSAENVSDLAQVITDQLKKDDPTDADEFDHNLHTFQTSLTPIKQKLDEIKSESSTMPIALTETIFLYQALPAGLKVMTPFTYEKAVAEGNDPSAADVQTTNMQVSTKRVKVLIYNSQTVTPITTNLQKLATSLSIPIIPVSETMPQNMTYQQWMMSQLVTLQQALHRATK